MQGLGQEDLPIPPAEDTDLRDATQLEVSGARQSSPHC